MKSVRVRTRVCTDFNGWAGGGCAARVYRTG